MLLEKDTIYRFSGLSGYLKRSVMRDLLALAVKPGILSLAGGLPAGELLPMEQFQDCLSTVIARDGAKALQYSPPYAPLKEWIVSYMHSRGVDCTPEQVFLTNGNQQGVFILSRLFLDHGDTAVIEDVTFTGIQQVTSGRGCTVTTIPTDLTTGADIEALETLFTQGDLPRLVILIPDFHNPLGVSMSLEKRRYAADLANHYGVPLVEDDPYSALRFTGETLPPIKAFDTDGFVFYLGSFSKMLAPTLRLGWMIVPADLVPKVTVIRESIDLESSTLTQRAVYEFLQRGYLEPHLTELNESNHERYSALNAALERHLGDIATWTKPEGGLFVWTTLPEHINTWEMLPEAIHNGVVYIPGAAFAVHGGYTNTMRLNFSNVKPHDFDEALRRLAQVIRQQL